MRHFGNARSCSLPWSPIPRRVQRTNIRAHVDLAARFERFDQKHLERSEEKEIIRERKEKKKKNRAVFARFQSQVGGFQAQSSGESALKKTNKSALTIISDDYIVKPASVTCCHDL